MRLIIGRHHTLIEGSAAVAVAGFLQTIDRWTGQDIAIILCGANVDAPPSLHVTACHCACHPQNSP